MGELKKYFLVLLITAVCLEVAAKFYVYFLNGKVEKNISQNLFALKQNSKTGGVMRPGIKARHTFRSEGQKVFDVEYNINSKGWRSNKAPEELENIKTHIAIFGDSYTFGLGLERSQTLSARLSERMSSAAVYNFGVIATGPNFALRAIELMNQSNIVPVQGVGIYWFNDFMVDRIKPDFGLYRGPRSPKYILDKKGKLKYIVHSGFDRLYLSIRKWISRLSFFYVLRSLRVRKVPSLEKVNLVAKIFKKIQFTYEQKFTGSKFYVVLNARSVEIPRNRRLVEALRQESIPYISLEDEVKSINYEPLNTRNFHPSAATIERLSTILEKKLLLQL